MFEMMSNSCSNMDFLFFLTVFFCFVCDIIHHMISTCDCKHKQVKVS